MNKNKSITLASHFRTWVMSPTRFASVLASFTIATLCLGCFAGCMPNIPNPDLNAATRYPFAVESQLVTQRVMFQAGRVDLDQAERDRVDTFLALFLRSSGGTLEIVQATKVRGLGLNRIHSKDVGLRKKCRSWYEENILSGLYSSMAYWNGGDKGYSCWYSNDIQNSLARCSKNASKRAGHLVKCKIYGIYDQSSGRAYSGQEEIVPHFGTEIFTGTTAETRLQAVRQQILEQGVRPHEIRISRTSSTGDDSEKITLSFESYISKPIQCDRRNAPTANNPTNFPHPDLGCSMRANIAAMVVNPADLERPQARQPSDASRRGRVIKNYRAGEATEATRGQGESASSIRGLGQSN